MGDAVRTIQLPALASLLARGIRVALIYGDADVICNWHSGQNASLELAQLVPSYRTAFPAAGYADIVVNDTYIGGHVRQYGNLSFSRIFDAGHLVPFYQPETAFTVFTRVFQGDDVATGRNVNLSSHATEGIPDSAVHRNTISSPRNEGCWIRDVPGSCTPEEQKAIQRGEGVVKNGVWSPGPAKTVVSEKPDVETGNGGKIQGVVTSTTTVQLTGVFTATGAPMVKTTPSSGVGALRPRRIFGKKAWRALVEV